MEPGAVHVVRTPAVGHASPTAARRLGRGLGGPLERGVRETGDFALFAIAAFRAIPGSRQYLAETLRQAGRIITGSALHIWQQEPEAMRQVEIARAIYKAKVPFYGSCWGLQVATVAAGGVVHKNPRGREMGIARKIVPNAAGSAHPLLKGRPAAFDSPCSHLDEVATLPPDSTLLASNGMSRVQAAEIRHEGGTFWGVQYHPEYTLGDIAFLIDRRMGALMGEGFFADPAEKDAYVRDLRAIDEDPALTNIAWRYNLGPELTDTATRNTELRNFIEERVRPRAMARAA